MNAIHSARLCIKHVCRNGKSKRNALLVDVFGGICVLQKSCGRKTRRLDVRKEIVYIVLFKGGGCFFYSFVFVEEMKGTHNCAVAALFAKGKDVCHHVALFDLAQNALAEICRNRFHFGRDRSVVFVKVCVVSACVYDAKRISVGRKVKIGLFNDGIFGILKVDCNKAACGASHLVHKSAGLAEMNVFGILRDLCNLDVADLALVVEVVEDVSDHILESGGRRKSRALENAGCGVSIKTAVGKAVFEKAVANTADDGAGFVKFALVYLVNPVKRNDILGEAFGLDADLARIVLYGNGDDIKAYGCGNYLAVVVVGVVSRDLTSAGNREKTNFAVFFYKRGILGEKAVDCACITVADKGNVAIFAIKLFESGVVAAADYFGTDFMQFHFVPPRIYFKKQHFHIMYIFSIASIVTFFKYYLVLKIFICNALTNSVFFDIILMCVMMYWKEEYLLGRAVMVTSFKGGVGKTTVSANLAMSLARMGFRVIAVDCDLESRCLDIALGLENSSLYNICEVLTGKHKLEEAIVCHPECHNLSFVAAPAYFSLADEDSFVFTEEQVQSLVLRLKLEYDFVIFDLPARPDKLYKSLVKYSNYALVISLHTAASIRAAEKTAMALEELGCGEACTDIMTKSLKTRLIINSFMCRDAVNGDRPSIYDVINKTSVKLIGVLPFDEDMARGQESGMLAYRVKKGKNNFNRAITNVAKRFTETQVPLLEGIKLDVSKSRLT